MRYILMHKIIPVCEIDISDASFSIENISKIYNPEHIPLGLTDNGEINLRKFNKWYRGRSIPASRQGLNQALDIIGITHQDELILKCYGLSLSDQYWFKPIGSDLQWKEINFFDNDFSEDVGNALFGNPSESDKLSLVSPDNTSDGWLKKKWTIINGRRCLVKSGSAPFFQEPLNEKIASVIQFKLNYMPFVEYDLIFDDEQPLSICENFINSKTELISAYSIYETLPKEKSVSSYEHFKRCCDLQGISNTEKFLDYMLTVDYIIANIDRHFRNFGVIRNAETLEWIGFAPLFDCGTSLWFNQIAKNIKLIKFDESKPFANSHSKQIELAADLTWIDFSKFNGIEEECHNILNTSKFIDEVRCENICYALSKRIDMLKDRIISDIYEE